MFLFLIDYSHVVFFNCNNSNKIIKRLRSFLDALEDFPMDICPESDSILKALFGSRCFYKY